MDGRQEGRKEGREEGRKEGRREGGKKEGREGGREEGRQGDREIGETGRQGGREEGKGETKGTKEIRKVNGMIKEKNVQIIPTALLFQISQKYKHRLAPEQRHRKTTSFKYPRG